MRKFVLLSPNFAAKKDKAIQPLREGMPQDHLLPIRMAAYILGMFGQATLSFLTGSVGELELGGATKL